jgi:proteasome alpha subunit
MLTPYDWQEGIGNRAQYVEGKLSHGAPVLAVSLPDGIVVFAYKRQTRKIYEIYDRLIFSALGQQSDVEALRSSAVDFAHQEGYNRSEQDVTIQRVVNALSTPLKKAFNDFSSSPVAARSLFAEINRTVEEDVFYVLNYNGDYEQTKGSAVVAGTEEVAAGLREKLSGLPLTLTAEQAVEPLRELRLSARDLGFEIDDASLAGLSAEAVLLERSEVRENRFRVLLRDE